MQDVVVRSPVTESKEVCEVQPHTHIFSQPCDPARWSNKTPVATRPLESGEALKIDDS
jgi:hypothetical protein